MMIFLIIMMIFMATFAYAGIYGAPWFPTWSRDLVRFLKIADIKPGERFYDLGCGDGKLVFAAAGAGAKAVGFEISLLPYLLAKTRSWNVKNSKIQFKNLWSENLADADIVYLFLTPKANIKIKEKLEKELKDGARVVAYTWPIEGWTPLDINRAARQPTLYLYKMPQGIL